MLNNKIPSVGDKVIIEGIVAQVTPEGNFTFKTPGYYEELGVGPLISYKRVKQIIPKPVKFLVGDRVTVFGSPVVFEVKAVSGDFYWLAAPGYSPATYSFDMIKKEPPICAD